MANISIDLFKSMGYRLGPDGTYYKANMERPRNVVQKQQDDCKGKIDNGPKETKDHGVHYGTIQKPVRVFATFFISDNRRRDLDGALATIMDCLVKAGVIEDDESRIVREITVRRVDCEKTKEKVEVEIYEWKL